MERRLNIILGVFLVFLLLATGRNLLLKKTGKKQIQTQTKTTANVLKVSDAPPRIAPPVPEVKKVVFEPKSVPEAVNPNPSNEDEFCVSEWEKSFCQKLTAATPSFKGARSKDSHVTVVVDSTSYFLRTRDLLSHGVERSASEKKAIASALFLRDLMGTAKEQIRKMELTLIFRKDPMFPDNPETFAFSCSGDGLANQSSEIFSDEKLKAVGFDYSSFCKMN